MPWHVDEAELLKQKGPQRVERRRSTVEINLIAERAKNRGRTGRRGCVPLSVLLISVGGSVVLLAGLHPA
jgi:hypothetical protein